MHFKKFVINSYRAIEKAEVPVSNNLIPVIGVNESGKTSILKAILSFDRLKDKYNGGSHLDYKNKYLLGDHPCSITAEVGLDSTKDIQSVRKRLHFGEESLLAKQLQDVLDSNGSLFVTRNLRTRKYSIAGFDRDDFANERLAKAVYRSLPVILYFDDFSDRVPEAIHFQKARSGRYKHLRSKTAEWQRILEEVFKRATEGKHSLEDFVQMTDAADQKGLLSDIQDTLDGSIMKEWRDLKKWGSNLADDPADLELSLDFTPQGDRGFKFEFRVQDRSRSKARFFNITERSKGFQWFFNFSMKLKFNPKYKEDQKGAIYLLDEPGSYLHSSAQEELLKTLQKISKLNTVIYCTHSQHLLDPEVINLAAIKVAAKEEGHIKVLSFGSAGMSNYQGALTPLYQALRLRTGSFNKTVDVAVVTEGITDFYLFKLLEEYNPEFNFERVTFLPGAGAAHLKDLISFCIAWSEKYVVFLDYDGAGRSASKRYKEFFGSAEAEHFHFYSIPGTNSDVQLEDFLDAEDQQRILQITGAAAVKAALARLYYGEEKDRRAFIKGLSRDTLSNLAVARGTIKKAAE